jgi:putative SOS response-associated peptidase YedK
MRLLVPTREELEAREVNDLVNSVREDGPALIEPRTTATLF